MWADDIGWFNPSCYHGGVMGYQTPNIDRIAREGARFTDWYGQQSYTAGRAAFIMGQSPIRTGLTKVGLPGATLGIQPQDPTIAELLKPHGYVCGQFGKNHLGDRNEFLPTVHGFDEFFGNLYHLKGLFGVSSFFGLEKMKGLSVSVHRLTGVTSFLSEK
jgi:arylsulfatase